jgi:hypothetical protein
MHATYSPDDNKLRLYHDSRLGKETYDRVKAAGSKWAPKQELFVAPAWTPEREDLLIELCGEIGDEDTSLFERAQERADRFEAGVQVVSAPNLFPTPPEVARRVVELAEIKPGRHRGLEPSAGTGAIVRALFDLPFGTAFNDGTSLVAVELNGSLADALRRSFPSIDVRRSDFLVCNGDLGKFDRIVMNPPFDHGADIRHVEHARQFLAKGGRLVAIVANGPRQREKFEPIATAWVDLPPGTFAGTNTQVAIVVIEG